MHPYVVLSCVELIKNEHLLMYQLANYIDKTVDIESTWLQGEDS